MSDRREAEVRVHDLLEVDRDYLSGAGADVPSWVGEWTESRCWAVVRRGIAPKGQIPVGIRGASRAERWGTFCRISGVRRIIHPEDLRDLNTSSERARTPAFRAFEDVVGQWSDLALAWGPIGSVAFESVTGQKVTTQASDLDLVLRAPGPLSRTLALSLLHQAKRVPVRIDVRVETSTCGFSLEEFARSCGGPILLRFREGSRLSRDPWGFETDRIETSGMAITV